MMKGTDARLMANKNRAWAILYPPTVLKNLTTISAISIRKPQQIVNTIP